MAEIELSDEIKEVMDIMIEEIDESVENYDDLINALINYANIDQKAKYTDSSMAYV